MDLERRELVNGFGETLSRAMEMVLTPLIFVGLGYLIDRALGTRPAFMAGLGTFAAIGMCLRMWFAYVESMKAHEAKAPWRRR